MWCDGLSTAAGMVLDGERYERNFADFIGRYHDPNMYVAGFRRYGSLEEKWAYWSRAIMLDRYEFEDNGTYVFNDADYNEIRVSKDVLGDKTYFLTDGLEVDALLYQDAVIDIELPSFIERKVIKCDPGVRGNTAAGKVTKPGTVEGGYQLPVPLFINEGDLIRIDTRTGEYADRVKA